MAELVGYSLSGLEAEKAELQKDLLAFSSAESTIGKRLLEVDEENPSRGATLRRWGGTWACLGSLNLATDHIEKNIIELDELIRKVKNGEAPNLDKKPRLGLVKEDGA